MPVSWVVLISLSLALVAGACGLSARLKKTRWAGRKVILKGEGVQFGQMAWDGSFVPSGVFDEAVVTVARRQGDWLATWRGEDLVWFLRSAAVPADEGPGYFGRLTRENPLDAGAWACRGIAWATLGQPERAIEDFTEALRLDGRSWATYWWRGNAWLARKDYGRALADFSEVLRIDPTSLWGLLSRAAALYHTGEYDRALEDCNEAIRLAPGNALGFNNRGWAWLGKREFDRALADFTEAIRLAPKWAEAFACRAGVRLAKYDCEGAVRDYDEAIALDPYNPNYLVGRGRAWTGLEAHDKASADFTAALRLDPSSADAYVGRGWARVEQKKLILALADFGMAARRAPASPYPLVGSGLAWAQKRYYREALKDLEKALELGRADAWAHNGLAWVLSTCPDAAFRDGPRAVQLATRACELTKWLYAGVIDTLAVAHAEAGNFELALKYQKQALALPDFPASKRDAARQRLELFAQGQPYRE
jgi:tetratricopeptide (TPR) repeat protein